MPVALAGALLWGLGAPLGFPVGMSAAADDSPPAAVRVSVVGSIGYTAFLAGPPLIGLLAEHFGILRGLFVVVGALTLGLVAAGAARAPPGAAARPPPRPRRTRSAGRRAGLARRSADARRRVSRGPGSGMHGGVASSDGPAGEKLQEYRAKRDFAVTAEPAGAEAPTAGGGALRRPAPPGPAAALRLPARGRRRARQLGGAPRAVARPGGAAARGARRGPPAGVRRLRGRDPRAGSTAAAT